MVAEPKPHQTGRKRQNVSKTGNDWDYYYDSYYASASFPPGPPRLVPPLKRQRLMVPPARPVIKAAVPPKQQQPSTPINQLKTYSNPDILICGNCREMFTELQELLDHKKTYCKLRFTCKCHKLNSIKTKSSGGGGEELCSAMLLCVLCKDSFHSAWDLMVHVQAAHMMNIYELGLPKQDNGVKNEHDLPSPAHSPSSRASNDKDKHGSDNRDGTPTLDDDDVVDLSADDNMTALDLDKMDDAQHEKDVEELMAVESTAQACIMRALSIEQSSLNKISSTDKSSVKVAITNGDISVQE